MLHALWLTLYRICVLGAIVFSALLYVHYLSPVESGFCASGGGCEAVRGSGFSYFGSRFLNIPLVGLLSFGALFGASLAPTASPLRRWLHWPSVAGGVVGLALIVTQALVLNAFCWMCLVVDAMAVATAFISLSLVQSREPQRQLLRPWAWSALGVAAVLFPLSWNWAKPPAAVPAPILALYEPGKINVVEFADFQCPHCKRFNPILKRSMKKFGDRVRFVRKHMPLTQHRFALKAAKGHLCADEQQQGEPMADLLMKSKLAPTSVMDVAKQLSLDLDAFSQCLEAPRTSQRIAADQELLETAGFKGLPTTYIGGRILIGAKPAALVQEALQEAAAGGARGGIPGALFFALAAIVTLAVTFLGRERAS